MYKLILFLVFLSLCLSCNNSEKQTTKPSELKSNHIQSKRLRIDFTFRTNRADVFKIMMNNIVVDELQNKNIQFFEDITPTTGDDLISVEFDANNTSKNILINLGNKEVKEVEIKSISVSYGDNHFSFNTANEFNKYFAFNRFIEKEEEGKTLTTKKVDGIHNPAISLRQNLIKLLKRE